MNVHKPQLVKRKRMRMKNHNYSQPSAYFITICAAEKKPIFCEIVPRNGAFETPEIKLSDVGEVVDECIKDLNDKYDNIIVENYVIMPNHLHMIITITAPDDIYQEGMLLTPCCGMSGTPSPTNMEANAAIPSFVGTLKRFANKKCGFSMFQRSYHDHIIRDQRDYDEIWDYIESNPAKWKQDCFYETL